MSSVQTKDRSLPPKCSMTSPRSGALSTSPRPQPVMATVKSMKRLVRASWTGSSLDEDKLARVLLQYRNTPSRRDGLSPAQKWLITSTEIVWAANSGHPTSTSSSLSTSMADCEWQSASAKPSFPVSPCTHCTPKANTGYFQPR